MTSIFFCMGTYVTCLNLSYVSTQQRVIIMCIYKYKFLFAALQYTERFANTWKGSSDHKISTNFILSVYALDIQMVDSAPVAYNKIIQHYNIWSVHRESSRHLTSLPFSSGKVSKSNIFFYIILWAKYLLHHFTCVEQYKDQ